MTNRRRFLAISAAAIALPGALTAKPIYTWKGTALGARATLRLDHPDAKQISARVAAEISRLEDIFSLYRQDSALARLNRSGALQMAPFELLECLSLAGAVHAASGGRFDPTIQTLWASYAEAFATGGRPTASDLHEARGLTGWDNVVFNASAITMRTGMALTLNGIAQGYIADRVAEMLQAEGLTNILIDTGEFRALGSQPDGKAWPVRLAAGGEVPLAARALATSAPLGTTFDDASEVGHILDPRTGEPSRANWREITVSAKSAALADALSTAACLFQTRAEIDACLAHFQDTMLEAVHAM
ncbi:Thiamine biosynthesis lipoprotein ApbE precursor [Thalassovita gelatinovora]|uniref:FAD:protein FMN transferase n=1 Tax=Thalassovita gelatinovora TaxID=53501 RepID=A0A0P1F5P6_THAGE|nr:FAD:protein FMN transferase [Thalassovita gelatinovora]QIZ79566.1 FAD:protein FMN transferase [Thalassovita gelatinovora]CUH63044.1 Thiamine biosynthesis lipoprotein ApbE precursor [Thalassovita gelatinovora]SEQ14760.1 thiamine biosynthesis lipoprotein [Thalassovita gelatinovora]